MSSDAALQVTAINLAFPGAAHSVQVLDGVSLAVEAGQFVSVIGPSGSGKSSLFHVIGGLHRPDSGQVRINGLDTTGQRGHISYMPQQPALFPWRTVRDNVLLGREIAGVKDAAALTEATRWLERVGLADYAQALPHTLSGGMQQRAAFLRALLSPQELLCLDEPFSALDSLTRKAMQQWLLRIWEETRRAVLFVTHDIEEALLLSDAVYVLSKRPARVIERLAVGFARPRQGEIADSPAFIRLRRHLLRLLDGESTSLH